MSEGDNERKLRAMQRAKTVALINRESTVNRIKAILELSVKLENEPNLVSNFLVAAEDLESLWDTFTINNQAVLDALMDLDAVHEFSTRFEAEVRSMYVNAKSIVESYKPLPVSHSINGFEDDRSQAGSVTSSRRNRHTLQPPGSRLPKIPLPSYNGDLSGWLVFRDRFTALVGQREELSNIERFYYLLGCLQGEALHSISNIVVSDNTYELAWNTLVDRFDKPRQLATSIVDKLLSMPSQSQETLDGLKTFLTVFSDQVSMLESLNIPDLGTFLLFALSTRCLPLSTRKGFETGNNRAFPSVHDIVTYVKGRVSLLEAVGASGNGRPPATSTNKLKVPVIHQGYKTPRTTLLTSKSNETKLLKCLFCSGDHLSYNCSTFHSLSVEDRYKTAREKRICFRCLNSTHWSNRCKVPKPCDKCDNRHHPLLHRLVERFEPKLSTAATELSSCVSSSHHPMVLLGTAQIHIRDQSGGVQLVRALVDSASHISAITSLCAERLGLKRHKWTVPLSGLSGVSVPNVKGSVDCLISPRATGNCNIHVKAWVLPSITGHLPLRRLPSYVKERFAHLTLADPCFDNSAPVDVLLGADVFSQIWNGRQIVIDNTLPTAFGSLFGWILIGSVIEPEIQPLYSSVVSLTVSLEDLVQRFWQSEEPDSAPPTFTKEGQCESIYVSERIRDSTGRFAVPLPFMNDYTHTTFIGSRQLAIRRFQNLENKLQSNPDLKKAYTKFMDDYESLGHMSIAINPGTYFIPHHPVFKGDSDTGKLRVVFDASAMTSSKISLNHCLYTGPKLQQDIVEILLRFRVNQFVFTTDVCKMYRQISILPKYRTFQHIFWRSSPLDELKEYELNTVTYGVNCSPFLALRVLQDIAESECVNLPEVREALQYQTYVDDICVGADDTESLLKLQSNLKIVLSRAGFELKKWSSNSPLVLAAIPPDDRALDVPEFDNENLSTVKVLGLRWYPSDDNFKFDIQPSSDIVTKRAVLSTIARIFDPLGFLAPITFQAKHVMQKIWKANLAWDESLPQTLADDWRAFVADFSVLLHVRIPRYLLTQTQSHVQLCGFCDASERGYAAVVYLRVALPNNTFSVSLIGTKTKMAPMKAFTIPRLELCAAVLLARWMSRVLKTLSTKLIVDGLYAWSDSQIVLSWLSHPHTMFKVFVSNRVHQVQQLIPDCRWNYIRSNINPADCASRGMLPSEFVGHSLYWSGPDFLYKHDEAWETSSYSGLVDQSLPEVKVASLTVQLDVASEWFSRFSSYTNMIRVVAWIRRFVGRCKRQSYPHLYLNRAELNESLVIIIKCSQSHTLSSLLADLTHDRVPNRRYVGLRPFIDSTGLVRVGGRLKHSDLADSQKQPILLCKTSYLSILIVRHWHLVTCHSGPRVITSLINRTFWILSVRVVIRKILGSCTVCVRTIARTPQPLMGELPAARVQSCRPFARVGIDYAGPLSMRECKLRKARQYKIYIAVFVCMVIKAVHLEIVLDVSTDAFLAAFNRFTSRRGLPQDVYSDCGTNFVGAANQLRLLVNHPDNHHMLLSRTSCSWHFNPPSAPHFGGLWEAAVRSTKTLLVRVLGSHNPTLEEMSTILCRIEATLNSRPLTPMTSSFHDLDYLSPGHFLIGQPLLAVPELPIPDEQHKLISRWKLLHQIYQSFWRRWSSEYLQALQTRTKWTTKTPNLQVGNMVVVKSNQGPPMTWRMGRIVDVKPGHDGIVRVARVFTSQGEITRPVVKLVLLPTD